MTDSRSDIYIGGNSHPGNVTIDTGRQRFGAMAADLDKLAGGGSHVIYLNPQNLLKLRPLDVDRIRAACNEISGALASSGLDRNAETVEIEALLSEITDLVAGER